MAAHIWYEVAVTAEDGRELDNSPCGNLEGARRAVARLRALYPSAEWIITRRHNRERVTALIAMTVHKGTTAAERRQAAYVAVTGNIGKEAIL